MKKQLMWAFCAILLSACGSSGGGDDGDDDVVDLSLTSRELNDINFRLYNEGINNLGPDYADIPTGEVQYEGAAFLSWLNETGGLTRIRGAVEVTANLASSGVTGEINRIVDASSSELGPYQGTLPIEGLTLVDEMDYTPYDGTGNLNDPGVLNLTGGTVIGTITNPAGNDVSFDTTIEADFRGDDGQYLIGSIEGDVTDNGFATTIFSGNIAAENDTTILP